MVGFLVVSVLADTKIDDSRRHPTVPPALDIGLGVAALVFAVVVLRRVPRDKKERRRETRLATAVVLGLAMGSPSPMYLMSLHSVAQAKPAAGVRTAEVVLIAAIVLMMAELPILTYLIAPERTYATLSAANAWFARNGRIIGAVVAAGAGCYFVVKGLVRFL